MTWQRHRAAIITRGENHAPPSGYPRGGPLRRHAASQRRRGYLPTAAGACDGGIFMKEILFAAALRATSRRTMRERRTLHASVRSMTSWRSGYACLTGSPLPHRAAAPAAYIASLVPQPIWKRLRRRKMAGKSGEGGATRPRATAPRGATTPSNPAGERLRWRRAHIRCLKMYLAHA